MTVTGAACTVPVGAFAYTNYQGDIYILGGSTSRSSASTTVQRYHPDTDTWDVDTNHGGTLAPLPGPRAFGFNAGVIGNKIHAVSGWDENQSYRGDHFIYDPSTNSWSTGAAIPGSPIGQFSATVGDALYVFGGWWGSYASTGYKYTDAGWSQLSPMPTPRNHATTAVVDGKIYVIGGEGGQPAQQVPLNVVEAFDPQTNTWTTGLAPLPIQRSFLGWSGSPVLGGRIFLIDNFSYDPTLNAWSNMAPAMPNGIACAVERQGLIYGFATDQTVASDSANNAPAEVLSLALLIQILPSPSLLRTSPAASLLG